MIAEEELEDDEEEKRPSKKKIIKSKYQKFTTDTKGNNAKQRKELRK